MGTNNNALIQQRAEATLIVWLGGSAACDIIIAVCMIYLVCLLVVLSICPLTFVCQLAREKQGLSSDKIISRLIHVTIETGSVTAGFACLDLILCMVFKHNNLHMLPYVCSISSTSTRCSSSLS